MTAVGQDIDNTQFLQLTLNAKQAQGYAEAMKSAKGSTTYKGDDKLQKFLSGYATYAKKEEKTDPSGAHSMGDYLTQLDEKSQKEYLQYFGAELKGGTIADKAGAGGAKQQITLTQGEDGDADSLEVADAGSEDTNYTRLEQQTNDRGNLITEGSSHTKSMGDDSLQKLKTTKKGDKPAAAEEETLLTDEEMEALRDKVRNGGHLKPEERAAIKATKAAQAEEKRLLGEDSEGGSSAGGGKKAETFGEKFLKRGLLGVMGVGGDSDEASGTEGTSGGASRGAGRTGSKKDNSDPEAAAIVNEGLSDYKKARSGDRWFNFLRDTPEEIQAETAEKLTALQAKRDKERLARETAKRNDEQYTNDFEAGLSQRLGASTGATGATRPAAPAAVAPPPPPAATGETEEQKRAREALAAGAPAAQ